MGEGKSMVCVHLRVCETDMGRGKIVYFCHIFCEIDLCEIGLAHLRKPCGKPLDNR